MNEIRLECYLSCGIPFVELSEERKEKLIESYKSLKLFVEEGFALQSAFLGFNRALISLGYKVIDDSLGDE